MARSDMAPNDINHSHIAIVGGGMVGLSLAILLAQQNPAWRIVLIENHSLPTGNQPLFQPSFDGRSTALAAGTVNIFQQAGIWDSLQQHLTAINTVHVSDRGHFGGAEMSAASHGLPAVGYVVENAWLGRVLLDTARGFDNIHWRAPARVEQALPRQTGYELTLTSDKETGNKETEGGRLSTELLLLADGAGSPVSQQLGIGRETKHYGQAALVTNIECSQPHLGRAFERFTSGGPIALLPLGESDESRQMALVWTLPEDRADDMLALDDRDFLQQLQQAFGHRQGQFQRAASRSVYPLSLVTANEQIRRNLVLMGNAAHFLHPVAGQGFNLALRDCRALAQTLAGKQPDQPIGDLALLQGYLEYQQQDQDITIALGDQFINWFSSDRLAKSVLRNLGLLALDMLPMAAQTLSKKTMGLG